MTGYPPSLIRTKRRLIADPRFDPTAVYPLTVLELGAEKQADGSVATQMTLECHGPLALAVESLETNDWIEFEYSSHWPHKNYWRLQENGTYVERWICRSIIAMSRSAPVPLRERPPRPALPLSDFVRMQITNPWGKS